jgi:hypothetical protein
MVKLPALIGRESFFRSVLIRRRQNYADLVQLEIDAAEEDREYRIRAEDFEGRVSN